MNDQKEDTRLKKLKEEAEERLRLAVNIRRDAVQDEFLRVSADLNYYNARYADAMEYAHKTAFQRKSTRGRRIMEIRTEVLASGNKITDKVLEATVEADDEYIEACEEETEALGHKARTYGIVDAIRAKKDMLQSLGKHIAIEMSYDNSIREVPSGRKRGDS